MPILTDEHAITNCGQSWYVHNTLVPILISWSTPTVGWVLDLGCGFGDTTETISKTTKGDVVGVELISKYIRTHKHPTLHLIIADANHLPFRNGTFKTIFCIGVLHHIQNLPSTVTEITRVLSGTLVGAEPNSLSPYLSNIWGLRKLSGLFLGTGERAIDPRWFTTLLTTRGYTITHTDTKLGLRLIGVPFDLILSPELSGRLYKALLWFDRFIPKLTRASFIFRACKEYP